MIYLGSQAIAEVDANGVHELHNDHLGTPLFITVGAGRPSAGTIEGRQVFGAYGESLINEGYFPLTGYTGHMQTDDTGLIYMRARYYSPQWHRFLSSDQGVDEAQMNQFAYVNGSPFTAADPSGMMWSMSWRFLALYGIEAIGAQSDYPFDERNDNSGQSDDIIGNIDPLDPVAVNNRMPISPDQQFGWILNSMRSNLNSGGGRGASMSQTKKDCLERAAAAYRAALSSAQQILSQPIRGAGQRFTDMYFSAGDDWASHLTQKAVGMAGGALLGGYAVLKYKAATRGIWAAKSLAKVGRFAGPLGAALSWAPEMGQATAGGFDLLFGYGKSIDASERRMASGEAMLAARGAYIAAKKECQ